ncbi:efflux RND transporter periplasmic adaptor subunit [Pseudomonas putida]|uniref:efflux RND transporter periplasmic adaptor subunit n=1 Tax=Pseudomonas putida TaxID=303 RepID=UPI0008191ADE|nr:efflux RND transporter periplasmic adaptor subunit [Pseudomonas putida]OCT21399.1 efflux transporter periplasmic adaptor subunit [Pseudomonas putida]OCT23140.1 efflux transporter periplasmic adaptor subunit [Pseudomonas putida]OCT23170.1 efflux transporter periplasmic adaptor subunit [Pseudomonas putida]OCT36130.1 efflux transporter periplasmic adaptor subunit [Pseudomonas putida]
MGAHSRSRRRLALYSAGIFCISGLIAVGVVEKSENAVAQEGPLPIQEVEVALVKRETVTDWQIYSGRLAAVERVEVRPLVAGTITQVNIHDGQLVKKGDTLFVIDPRPYQAQVERAKGQVAAAQARVAYTKSDWQRAQRLITDNAIAQRDYDEKNNAALEASANLKTAEAALDAAKIDLGHTQVRAPISGRVSRAEITLGNIVNAGAGAGPLTTLVSVSPVYAEFNADEQTYLKYINRFGNKGNVRVDLGLADETGYSRQGVIQSVDNELDTTSGTIRMRARFDNADGVMVPGLYARVKVGGSEPYSALLVDDAAIGTDQDKRFVLVVGSDDHIVYRPVALGNLYGNERIITSGLEEGERVVVGGIQRVRPGEHVVGKLISRRDAQAMIDR